MFINGSNYRGKLKDDLDAKYPLRVQPVNHALIYACRAQHLDGELGQVVEMAVGSVEHASAVIKAVAKMRAPVHEKRLDMVVDLDG